MKPNLSKFNQQDNFQVFLPEPALERVCVKKPGEENNIKRAMRIHPLSSVCLRGPDCTQRQVARELGWFTRR